MYWFCSNWKTKFDTNYYFWLCSIRKFMDFKWSKLVSLICSLSLPLVFLLYDWPHTASSDHVILMWYCNLKDVIVLYAFSLTNGTLTSKVGPHCQNGSTCSPEQPELEPMCIGRVYTDISIGSQCSKYIYILFLLLWTSYILKGWCSTKSSKKKSEEIY